MALSLYLSPARRMGFSRDTFYHYQAAVKTGGVEALIDASRRKPNIKSHAEEATRTVTTFALEQPAFGKKLLPDQAELLQPILINLTTNNPGFSYI